MQLALSTTIAPPSLPVWEELSGNLPQGFTTQNQGWKSGPNVVNSTTAIGLRESLLLEGFRQSHSARYYNPVSGRFMSRDPNNPQPLGPDRMPTDPIMLHKYLYAKGDPVNAMDPSGRGALERYATVFSLLALADTGYNLYKYGSCVSSVLKGVGAVLKYFDTRFLPDPSEIGQCGIQLLKGIIWPFPGNPPF